jgi:hypothetical protein
MEESVQLLDDFGYALLLALLVALLPTTSRKSLIDT